jgi:hypothetical protein
MRLFLSNIRGEIDAAVKEIQRPMAEAATAALKEVAATAVASGKVHLASKGFSAKSQKGFASQFFPKSGASLRASTRIFHRVGYFGLFEEGGTITGKPKLWLPTDAVPRAPGGRRKLRPREFSARFGGLRSVNHPGRVPMLVGRVGGKSIPVFVGVSSVTLRKRIDLYGVIDRAASRFGEYYVKNVK